MHETALSFKNSRGLQLSGALQIPKGPHAPFYAILNHGMLSNKASRKHIRLSERLVERGIPTFRFDYSGQGESEGHEELITYSNGLDDLSCAMDLLKRQGAVRFLLCGSSMGAGISMLMAARYAEAGRSDIIGLALMASIVRTGMIWRAMRDEQREMWRSQGYYKFQGRKVAFDIVEDGRQYDIPKAIARFHGPVLYVHGTHDELIDYRQISELETAHPGPTTVKWVEGADHRFSDTIHRQTAIDTIVNWVADTLPG